MNRLLHDLLFVPKCVFCRTRLPVEQLGREEPLCDTCRALWESEKLEHCGGCGKDAAHCTCMPEELEAAKCEGCRKLVFYRRGVRSVQSRLIWRIKNGRRKKAIDFLACEMAAAARELLGDAPGDAVITYVPRRRDMKLQNDTDQARDLAEALAKELTLPCRTLLWRDPAVKLAQKSLGRAEREKNARAAYRVLDRSEVKGQAVLLLDDVITSGSTMAACCRKLRRAGARAVYVLSVAYTVEM